MLFEEFADCCGAVLLHDLFMNESLKTDGTFALDVERYRAALQINIENARKAKYGLLVAITNPPQENAAVELQQAGFKLCMEAVNPGHGTLLKLWALNLNLEKSTPEVFTEDPIDVRDRIGVTIQGQPRDEAYPGENDWYPDDDPF